MTVGAPRARQPALAGHARTRGIATATAAWGALLLLALASLLPAEAAAETSSEPASPAAGRIAVGALHSCVLQAAGEVRCWGYGAEGELGTGSASTVGDDETPGSVAPVSLGADRTATAIAVGDFHACALLDNASVRCWGFGANGRLGYANTENVGDDETPGSVGPVFLGTGRTAVSITAGSAHTCAVLDDGSVRCWGFGEDFRLGRNDASTIGDDETPGSIAPVSLDRDAVAVSAGLNHTCALLDDGAVRCWGLGRNGQLGYGNTRTVGDPMISVDSQGNRSRREPVSVGAGRGAVAISAGGEETCAVLDDGAVRCWGYAGFGRLGYANTDTIGDDETPGSVAPVSLVAGARAISVGDGAACARLDGGAVRCWGLGGYGQLGYGSRDDIGDDEAPATVGPVDLGAGRTALAIGAGRSHTCARLDDGSVRCWGQGADGRLGLCGAASIGDDETPGSAGPVQLTAPPGGGTGCPAPGDVPAPPGGGMSPATPASGAFTTTPGASTPAGPLAPAPSGFERQAARARGLRICRANAARRARLETRRARRRRGARRIRAEQHARRHRTQSLRRCLTRWGRTPGAVSELAAFGAPEAVLLVFDAPGTDGDRGPAAHSYLIKQSRRPIHGERDFRDAHPLCDGRCFFPCVTRVGTRLKLTVTDLRPRTTYYYAIRARDNVSGRLGPRSKTVKATAMRPITAPPSPPPKPCPADQR